MGQRVRKSLVIFPRENVAPAECAKLKIAFPHVEEIALAPVYQRPHGMPLISSAALSKSREFAIKIQVIGIQLADESGKVLRSYAVNTPKCLRVIRIIVEEPRIA